MIPFNNPYKSPYSYYLLTEKSANHAAKIQLFIDWILVLFASYRLDENDLSTEKYVR